jgi:hypothetical protein
MDIDSVLYHLVGLVVAAGVVWRIEASLPACDWQQYVLNTWAWCMAIGGGTYGLGLFDSKLLPVFSWPSMMAVIAGAIFAVLAFEHWRRKVQVKR